MKLGSSSQPKMHPALTFFSKSAAMAQRPLARLGSMTSSLKRLINSDAEAIAP
jgi:hypothetical protein